MIDDGQPPLGEVTSFGNYWHGSYDTVDGFRSRANTAMPLVTASTYAQQQRTFDGSAHLVDFGMPEVTTPVEEFAIGMQRWNKAILYGQEHAYSIMAAYTFGNDGWPYRAPDGTVWHLQARKYGDYANLGVFAVKVGAAAVTPSTMIATCAIPSGLATSVYVNFSPDGTKAAAHNFANDAYGPFGNIIIGYIAEIAISGGEGNALPTAAVSVTYDENASISNEDNTSGETYIPGYGSTSGAVISTTYEDLIVNGETGTHRRATHETIPTPLAATAQPSVSGYWIARVVMICYSKTGARQVIKAKVDTYGHTSSGGPQIIQNWIYAIDEYFDVGTGTWIEFGAPMGIQTGGVCNVITSTLRREYSILRNDAPIASVYDLETGVSGCGSSSSSFTGTALSGGVSCFDTANLVKFARSTANSVALWADTTNKTLMAYVTADYSAQYSYASPLMLVGDKFSFDPVTGNFSTTKRLWF